MLRGPNKIEANDIVDAEFVRIVDHACERPAMYVGSTSFEKLAVFLDGYAVGRETVQQQGLHLRNTLNEDFQRFLVSKYGMEAARQRTEPGMYGDLYPLYSNLIWWAIYQTHFKDKSEQEKCLILRDDFRDFTNLLTRMVVEAGIPTPKVE